jgi:hypothetical protein
LQRKALVGRVRRVLTSAFARQSSSSEQTRHQHRHPLAIAPAFIAEHRYQIALFQLDADEDVSHRHRGEQQMTASWSA